MSISTSNTNKIFDEEMAKVEGRIISQSDLSELHTGDFLFFTGEYVFSKGTQFLSESIWNHLAVVVNMNDLFDLSLFAGKPAKDKDYNFIVNNPSPYFMVESVIPNGVRLQNFSKSHRYENGEAYRGRVAVKRLKSEIKKTKDYKRKYRDFLFSALGERYGNDELLSMATSSFIQSRYGKIISNERNSTPPYVCTELAYYLTKYTYGLDLVTADELLTPKQIYENKNLELIAELKLIETR